MVVSRIKTLASTTVKRYPIFAVREDLVQLPDGKEGTYVVLDAPDGCHVLAFREDGHIPLVCQHRYGAGREVLELPSGIIELGEDPLHAAQRELEEEVGATGGVWTPLGHHRLNAACQTNVEYCFLATSIQVIHPQKLDDDEFLEVHWATLPEVFQWVEERRITQASAICALYALLRLPNYRDFLSSF